MGAFKCHHRVNLGLGLGLGFGHGGRHVSPMQRWNISARIDASQRCPTLCHTRTVEAARSGATIRTHMMGNVTPGGVQLGITRSLKPPVFSPETAFARSGLTVGALDPRPLASVC